MGVNVADLEAIDIPVTLILSYIFVGIIPLYAINLDAVSMFVDSSFTFLAVLNDVISRFE
ncbi:transmembrane protein, putative [Medicago truncatula]|uniref:Transmembrane protein, putative n=1 Tax=Medicago truncatula TaxID=3880 RepID=G7KBI5_MEDTR|nr:transmembrane protein, putative [Medicago truncatula]